MHTRGARIERMHRSFASYLVLTVSLSGGSSLAQAPAAPAGEKPPKSDASAKSGAGAKVEKIRAQTMVQSILIAVQQFEVDYDRLPQPVSAAKGKDCVCETSAAEGIITAVKGQDKDQNPRQTDYLGEAPAATEAGKKRINGWFEEKGKLALHDPWGQCYFVALDLDGDGKMADPSAKDKDKAPMLQKAVLVWSAGPDGKAETWEDNICSWK